jgi:hypothetical protein
MSQVSYTRTPVGAQVRARSLIAMTAALAVIAAIAVLFALVVSGSPSVNQTADRTHSTERADGGPEETGVAAAIAAEPIPARPDESTTAAAIGSARHSAPIAHAPDESAVAAAIAGR